MKNTQSIRITEAEVERIAAVVVSQLKASDIPGVEHQESLLLPNINERPRTVACNFKIPVDLLERVNDVVHQAGVTKTYFYVRAVELALQRAEIELRQREEDRLQKQPASSA